MMITSTKFVTRTKLYGLKIVITKFVRVLGEICYGSCRCKDKLLHNRQENPKKEKGLSVKKNKWFFP